MEITLKKESTLTHELPSGNTLKIVIDHTDDYEPFDVTIGGQEIGCLSVDDISEIKKAFNKAIKTNKE